MNVADFIIDFLEKKGVSTVFMITGGQAMFLNDAVTRSKKIKPIFNHHEQAASMSAEAYSRVKNDLGVAMVTAGPGATNALTGVVGAWADSAPMMVISGQSNLSNVQYMENTKIRQIGLQGIFTKPIVQPVTKFFVTVDDSSKILYYLEKAYYMAMSGRTGPVWIEVPLDIQRMEVPKKLLKGFKIDKNAVVNENLNVSVTKIIDLIYKSRRPLFLIGQGVRIAKAVEDFERLSKKAQIPVVTTRLAIDVIDDKNKLFVGRPGLYGDRPANFAIQNADLIVSIGARLDTGIVGYDANDWGRNAKIVVVDIDTEELDKPGIKPDIKVKADASAFIKKLTIELQQNKLHSFSEWIAVCNTWKLKYPMVLPAYKKSKQINSYFFTDRLAEAAASSDTIVIDTSSIFHVACQTWKIKKGQRFITTGGISTMGYWVAAIGACLANNKGRTIVITGDGSLQMNVQEFATIKQNKLPIKVFVLNNDGYLLIRHTQKTHLGGRFSGESPKSGLWTPNPLDIANAYKIKGVDIESKDELDEKIKEVLNYPGPVVCNVPSPHWQLIIPRISSSKRPDGSFVSRPYEDLFPFLSTKELKENDLTTKDKEN